MNTAKSNLSQKTSSFQMRINPEIKKRAEELYAGYGLTLTDAINIFIQQSLNTKGLPFLLSPENETYLKGKAMERLMQETEIGFKSAEEHGWTMLKDVEARFGISRE